MRELLVRHNATGIPTVYLLNGKWVTATAVRRCACGNIATYEFYLQKLVGPCKVKRVVLAVTCDKHHNATRARLEKR